MKRMCDTTRMGRSKCLAGGGNNRVPFKQAMGDPDDVPDYGAHMRWAMTLRTSGSPIVH